MKTCRKIVIAIGITFVAVILGSIVHHYQLRAATEKYIAQLKAQDEPLELVQVIPPSVPMRQNGSDLLREADNAFNASFGADKSLLETNFVYGMKLVAPGKAMIRWQQPDIRESYETNSWKNLADAVAQNTKAFALLQRIIERPMFDFHLNYEQGVVSLDFTNLYLAQSKRSALRLESATLSDLRNGDTTGAVKNLRAILALIQAMHSERLEISELVRIAIASIALNTSWEILQSPNLTDEQLVKLQRDWENLEFIEAWQNALAMELVTGEISLAKWRSSNLELQSYFDLGKGVRESMGYPDEENAFNKLIKPVKFFLWRYWWSYPDELRMLKSYEVLAKTMRTAKADGSFQNALSSQAMALNQLGVSNLGDPMNSFLTGDFNFHSMLSESIVGLDKIASKVMRAETAKQMAITAITLKRYQIKHGNFPETLSELTPEFVPVVPLDPVDGQPLRYHRNADGTYRLYSVGENGRDDGGDSSWEKGASQPDYYSWQDIHALDWVWPQPASVAEIQKYYTNEAKKSE